MESGHLPIPWYRVPVETGFRFEFVTRSQQNMLITNTVTASVGAVCTKEDTCLQMKGAAGADRVQMAVAPTHRVLRPGGAVTDLDPKHLGP